MSEEEIKQLKLERDTAIFVARERLDEIERIKNQKEIFELRYLKADNIIKEVREYIEDYINQFNGVYPVADMRYLDLNKILKILDKESK